MAESLWSRLGIAGRGTGDSPHAQAAASATLTVQSPARRYPEGKGSPWCLRFPVFVLFNIVHNKVIAEDFALQIILFTLVYSEKNT